MLAEDEPAPAAEPSTVTLTTIDLDSLEPACDPDPEP